MRQAPQVINSVVLSLVALLAFAFPVQASSGTINSGHQYAWSTTGGWVNFDPTNGNVQVTNAGLNGYAWSANEGWINLSPANGGVFNDGNGNLSGFAWDESIGWIDFAGVTIDSSGTFHGTARGVNTAITFDCTGCTVQTTWSRISTPSPTETSDGTSGSSAPPSPVLTPPAEDTTSTEPLPATASANDTGTGADSGAAGIAAETAGSGSSGQAGKGFVSPVAFIKTVSSALTNGRVVLIKRLGIVAPVIQKVIVPSLLTTGVAVGIIGTAWTLVSTLKSLSDLPFILFRSFSTLLPLAAIGRKRRSWGTVYDSRTRRPLDPAVVTLKDMLGKEIKTVITDLDGRFFFLVPAGTYTIDAQKSHHTFPAAHAGIVDPIYDHPYIGGPIILEEPGIIVRDIPLDPIEFDWNETEKLRTWRYRFFSRFDKPLAYASLLLVPVGTITAILEFISRPSIFNGIFLALYVVLSALYLLGFRPRVYGRVRNADGTPIPFAVVRAKTPETASDDGTRTVADAFGRYYLLLPPEPVFDVTVEEPTGPNTYSPVYQKRFMRLRGRLNRTLTVESA